MRGLCCGDALALPVQGVLWLITIFQFGEDLVLPVRGFCCGDDLVLSAQGVAQLIAFCDLLLVKLLCCLREACVFCVR